MIKNREVKVDGFVILKPSFLVNENAKIELEDKVQYVSRAGIKLKGFIQNSDNFIVKGLDCLDIGSSTGGFVQVLLNEGAKSVSAVDVGKGQFHSTLLGVQKVKLYEQMDIRDFKSQNSFKLVTCDVSFISILLILDDIDRLSCNKILILFKPQFEVGLGVKRNTKGVIKDTRATRKAEQNFEAICFVKKWKLLKKEKSVLKGKEGNEETFYYFSKR